MQAEPQVQSVARALELLCCFSSGHAEWGLTEMSRHVGVSKSVVHRLLQTLEHYGFVERMPSRRYRLGARTLELGNIFRFDRTFVSKAEPFLRHLAEETGSIAHLGQLDGRDVLELARSSGPGAILFAKHPILRCAAHATALGKVLLAGGGEAAFQHHVGPRIRLERFTDFTISDPQELRRQLQEVRTNGYAVSDQESRLGCRCFAVPVKDPHGNTVAAVSVSSSVERFGFHRVETLLAKLHATAAAIASAL